MAFEAEVFFKTVRKDRTRFDAQTLEEVRIKGPTHAVNWHNLTWCGRKFTGFATWKQDQPIGAVDCDACKKAIEANEPRAWKR